MLPNILFVHSIIRYLILLFALIVSVQSLLGMMGKKEFRKSNRMMALFLLISCDLQLVLGLALYFMKGWANVLTSGIDMKNTYNRFWAIEHSIGMLVAIFLVHLGYNFIKRHMDNDRKFRRLFWCSFIALVIFMAMTPWEGKQVVGRPNIPSMQR